MKPISRIILALILTGSSLGFLASGVPEPVPQDPEVLFQRGVQLETLEGDLNAAIDLYQQVIKNNGNNRPIAAKALLRLGGCYEKQGKEEASRTYEQLLQDYADQTEPAAEARSRLAALRKPAVSESGPVTRRVWAGPKTDFFGSVSPDGKYISFVDWDTGDLAVRDLGKGTNHRLTNKGSWESSGEEAEKAIWSPDSNQIAYLWWTPKGYEIRLISLDDPTPRLFYQCKNDQEYIEPYDWSPDGRHILAARNSGTGKQIVLVSFADGAVHELKTLSQKGLSEAKFSPDGRYVVYDYLQSESSLAHDIFLIPTEGGNEIPLIEYPTDDVVLGWSPNGNWVLFASNRRGSVDTWAIQMEDGKPRGDPVVLKSAVGRITPLGLTRNGSLYFGVSGGSQDVYLAKLDSETGNILGSPTKFIKHSEGFNRSPQYSPDGSYLAYISKKAGMVSKSSSWYRGLYLYVRSLETGEDREYQQELTQLGLTRVDFPRWSPDGRSLLLYGQDGKGLFGIYHINLETGKTVCVQQGKEHDGPWAAGWLDERNFVYGEIDHKNNRGKICVRNLENGSEKVLFSSSPAIDGIMAVSPDRRWVSSLERYPPSGEHTLRILSADTGEVKQLIQLNQMEGPIWMRHTWSTDSKYIFFSSRVGTIGSYKWQMWRISIDGGQLHKTGLEMPGVIDEISTHPDGEHLVFRGNVPGSPLPEVWVLENFLPMEGN